MKRNGLLLCRHHDPEGPVALQRRIRILEQELKVVSGQRDRLRRNNRKLRDILERRDSRWRERLQDAVRLELRNATKAVTQLERLQNVLNRVNLNVNAELQPGDLSDGQSAGVP